MTRILIGLIAFCTTPCVAAQTAPSALQAALEKQFKSKVVTLRTFYPDEDVRFTPEGHYEGRSKPGPWTLWSRVKVRGIQVASDSVTIQGQRVYVVYDAKGKRFRNKNGERKRWVTIEFGSTAITPESVQTAFEKILLTKEPLSAIVPIEWQEFLKAEESGAAINAEPEGNRPRVLKVRSDGVTPPRAISAPNPSYQFEALLARLKGTVVLWAVVDEEGRVPAVRIARPVGMGLDEKAVEAVRSWQFEPAKKDGVPVTVEVNIEVHFELKSW